MEPTRILPTQADLRRELARIDGRGYPAYKEITGRYAFDGFTLAIDHVQGDPFAAPSRLRILRAPAAMGLPEWAHATPARRVATADWLARRFAAALDAGARGGRRGSGKSGLIAIDRPGQEILARSAAVVSPRMVELRFVAGLPAGGRRILGREAIDLLCEQIPALVEHALTLERPELVGRGPREGNLWSLEAQIHAVEDQQALRAALAERSLVAFVADGAILPRESGVSDRPLRGPHVLAFEAPDSLAVTLETPHSGPVRGLGIPRGVTLIVGGGYHGKSTLLRALSRGVYDHVPGDGRERVVTDATAVKIRAEDGRRIEQVDISPFIRGLPFDADTRRFCTDEASGSTSQAANIVEALELGARLLLIDEDTSATNFMIRDRRMQALVSKDREPITPFVDRVRALFQELGVSSVIVVGGAGDYLDVADTVIHMDRYRALDATERAREVARTFPTGRLQEESQGFPRPEPRIPLAQGLDPRAQRGRVKVRARETDEIRFGWESIDLQAVEQIVDPSQTRAIGALLSRLGGRYLDGRTPLREGLEQAFRELEEKGLDVLSPFGSPVGDLAMPRLLEVGAAVNRLRSLRVRGTDGPR
ncbi:ABC-ATPase domain-containing protein [Limnochorda pilosa]|uniref:ABC transporter ATPase n=1 Tax=Limnochorda pilosa TaxID=1555112 RepID=A0A0K2SHW3_LIMPI|nr:ABC-ATPase domain-containing protein [Limnochorda pilosa]BAS26688.1 ABC transporter ATPase [Limnochorda pilosa]